jgi:hypothetical protein
MWQPPPGGANQFAGGSFTPEVQRLFAEHRCVNNPGIRLRIRNVIIDGQEEFTRDWDWYAVDQDGHVGHFTSAGVRVLPKSVRQDRETTETIARYFFEQAPVVGKWSVGPEAEAECGGWQKQGFERYIRDFALMSSNGLFSFNSDLSRTEKGRYYLVAIPERPLLLNNLPPRRSWGR